MKWINDLYHQRSFHFSEKIKQAALDQAWGGLENELNFWAEADFYPWLRVIKPFQKIESMLSLRSGDDPDEDEGIWHDDGSRVMAFSCSLNYFGPIQGGSLLLKKKTDTEESALKLGPYPPGEAIVFKTGIDGAEHRVQKVESGKRLVFVGWCS